MNTKFNILMLALTFILSTGYAQEDNEGPNDTYHEEWPIESVETLHIINKYGEVKINDSGGDSVVVDVVITLEETNSSRRDEMLEMIDIDFQKSGNRVTAETLIDDNFKSRNKFSIDYSVNIPSDKNLIIENKFGDVFVNELDASGTFIVKYGKLTANSLKAGSQDELNIDIEYGNADIESMSDAEIISKYTTFNIEETNNVILESKYSTFKIEEITDLQLESKYDNFSIEEIVSLKASSKYTGFKIEELEKSIDLENEYGGFRVDIVSDQFELIDITNKYGNIRLGISDNVSYGLNASCDYCNVSYNENNFSGNRNTSNHETTVYGNIGNSNSGRSVSVESRYGEINLEY